MPERTWQFTGVVRLTKIGVSFIIFTVCAGFAAINTGNNALYIGLSFMLGALMLSGVASKGGLKHLRVELESVDEAWAGRVARGRLRVMNRSRIWNVRDLILTADELAAPILVSLVQRRGDVAVDAAFLFRRRGLVQLTSIDLYTRYPFGFFLKKRRVKIGGDVVVYPHLLDEDVARERFSLAEGDQHPSSRPGPGSDVHAFREYTRGDSLRHVAWKKSASLGRWIIKQTESDAGRAVHVVVDPYKPRAASDDDFERMVSEAATFLYEALRRDLEVIVAMPRVELRARGGESARAIFRALALLEPRYEPFAQTHERDSVVFAVRRADERKSA
ncbi:MAG TPA: DUF58 domain-containing protein [Thermoanaerobaculia bacterium]|nr:DUF58 domain-containing protein [Thermoanaerobaculia bacterium]